MCGCVTPRVSSLFDASASCRCYKSWVTCVQSDPLEAATFEEAVDVSQFSVAICLCDQRWIDPDADSSNGVDFLEQRDMLRLDSMLLLVQLHLRSALRARVRPLLPLLAAGRFLCWCSTGNCCGHCAEQAVQGRSCEVALPCAEHARHQHRVRKAGHCWGHSV